MAASSSSLSSDSSSSRNRRRHRNRRDREPLKIRKRALKTINLTQNAAVNAITHRPPILMIPLQILTLPVSACFMVGSSKIGAGVWDMMSGLLVGLPGFCFWLGSVLAMGAIYRSSRMRGFLGRGKEDGVRRSAVSGKKILLKLEKSKEDKAAENKRNELLKFLNASFD
ncbi:unnamed protein product [Dovyalis caffra]|uniref:Uncharacterized protein n=1 Tax=Dovyalis caffra TaxID=77055 RepID=A0AAV1RXQ3_9ROSI|nr:unnamed protein product [Dovyalis caffra]